MTNECRNINKTADIEAVLSVLLGAGEKPGQEQMLVLCECCIEDNIEFRKGFCGCMS